MEKEYTCDYNGCNRVFTNEEKKITNSNTCIFHCEKRLWVSMENKEYSKRINFFWKSFSDNIIEKREGSRIIEKNIFPRYLNSLNNKLLNILSSYNINFRDCIFEDDIEIRDKLEKGVKKIYFSGNNIFKGSLLLQNIKFQDTIEFNNLQVDGSLNIINCKFKNDVDFIDNKFKKVYIKKNIFEKQLKITNKKEYLNEFSFENSVFNSLTKIEENKKIILNFFNCKFLSFFRLKFNKEINLHISDCSFENTLIFTNNFFKKCLFNFTKFDMKVDLIDNKIEYIDLFSSIFYNYINITSSEHKYNLEKENIANRETARILKDSFEQQNNIIEANKFYALEMKEREKELKFYKEPFEWLVFKIHGLASNHSQDWILSLLWIINISLIVGLFNQSYYFSHDKYIFISFFLGTLFFIYSLFPEKYRKLGLLSFLMLFYILTNVDLDFVANLLNITTIFNSKIQLTFTGLIYKITIAYLIYQLIISIRQNTRRK